MHFKVLVISLLLILLEICDVRGAGVVTVGFNESTPQDLFVFTENDANPTLDVHLTDSTGVNPKVNGVTVACYLSPGQLSEAPFTIAKIDPKTLTAAATGSSQLVQLKITFTGSGRPVLFYCNATGNADFSAQSNMFSLQRKKAPTVSICSPVTEVPQRPPKDGSFKVMISDKVINKDVAISCTVESSTIANLNVSTNGTSVKPGEGGISKRISIPYTVPATGAAATVACTGKSTDEVQYKTSNSKGSATQMKMQPVTVKFLPERLKTSAPSFKLLLTLGTPVTRNTPEAFLCAVVKVADTAEETDAVNAPACRTKTATPIAATNSTNATSVVWVATHRVEMKTGEIAQSVEVTRSAVSMTPATERLVVTCCGNPSDAASIYVDTSAAALVTAEFPGYLPVNETVAKASSAETVLPNPAFVNPAPCPCDLTNDVCDQGCCCDSLCNKTGSLTPCLTGYFGGDTATLPSKPHRCSLPVEEQTEDYHALLCIMYENNAVLGKFYTPTATKLTSDEVNARIAESSNIPQLSNDGVRSLSNAATTYKVGAAVSVLWNEDQSGSADQVASLRLPGPGLKGSCYRDQLVRFLEDREASCDIAVTASCPPELSARSYLVGGNLTHPACPTYPTVLAAKGTKYQVPTQAEYFCVESKNLIGTYIKSSSPLSSHSSFSSSTGLSNILDCRYDAANGSVLCTKRQRISSTALSPPLTFKRCAFDDGYSAPPRVTYNAAEKSCDNAVLNVSYAFVWNETSITGLRVFVLMASVPVGQTLSQAFKVNFTHGSATPAKSGVLAKRSGVFGYEDGKPVIGGKRRANRSVDASAANWPFLLRPGSDGLCEQAGTEKVLFPYDSQSSCRIYLKMSDFSDCVTLRANLLAYLELLTPFDVLATYGSPDINSEKDWADMILPSQRKVIDIGPSIPNLASNISNSNITSDNTTTPPAPGGQVNFGTLGGFLGGKCSSVPVGVQVSVIYAKQGKARSQPIYQIIGARKEYIYSGLELNCLSSEDGPCTNTNLGQQFFLDLSFLFRQVPATWKQSIYRLYDTKVPCWWDICIDDSLELWYSSFYLGMRHEIIAYTLLLSLFAIPTFIFAWPW